MRRVRLAGRRHPRPAWALAALTAPAVAALLLATQFHGAERLAGRLATTASTISRHAPQAPQTLVNAKQYAGSFAVGALFRLSGGHLGQHFCTASVVDSKPGDLVITAAHCVSKLSPGEIAFVPGYHHGGEPHGVWTVSKVIVDSRWRRLASPDHDFAFLVVRQSGNTSNIQQVTGGEQLGTGWPARVRVNVIGYPDRLDRPIVCQRRTRPFGAHQMKFVCGGFTGGTSGGPFLANVSVATGDGTVIGVIGGYEQGGDLASVSYSPRFGKAMRALYRTASSEG
jgi:V8-like Glu-specific endopeptidase